MTYEQQNYHHTAPPRARQEVHFKEKGCIDLIIADELKSRPQASLELLSLKKTNKLYLFQAILVNLIT